MHFLHLTLLYCMLSAFSSDPAYPTSSFAKSPTSIVIPTVADEVEPAATNILYQSKDGGLTWEDVSYCLPVSQQPESFFAGGYDLYLRVSDVMYRSKSNLNVPIWEKVQGLDPQSNSIAFNRSGVIAYNFDGIVYQRQSSTDTWVPAYTNFKKPTMRTIFEAADGTLFLGRDNGLYKSADKGRTWKRFRIKAG